MNRGSMKINWRDNPFAMAKADLHQTPDPPAPPRLMVTLTMEEAAAILASAAGDEPIGLAKIRAAFTAMGGALPDPAPPLRSKDYRPPDRTQHFRQRPSAPPAPVDDYVPWRDEAGGNR